MTKRKLIEVALPLDAINAASKADKDRKVGTLRNLHKWFAPMPLPAWRALLFATLVDDPEDEAERDRLLLLIERLVADGSSLPQDSVIAEARAEIAKSWPDGVPTIMDPFCGGGSTLVEAQRLGLSTLGSDLNPVATLITRFLTQTLPSIAGQPPLHASKNLPLAAGPYDGFAADVLHYGEHVERLAKADLAEAYNVDHGQTPIAYLWCRTVTCPNPACGAESPLLDSFTLNKKPGDTRSLKVRYEDGKPEFSVVDGLGAGRAVTRQGVQCGLCDSPIDFAYIRAQGAAGLMGLRLTAVVEVANGTRSYRTAKPGEELLASSAAPPDDLPAIPIDPGGQGVRVVAYGLATHLSLFTPRQQLTLSTFARHVSELPARVLADGGDEQRAQAIAAFLGLSVGKLAQANSSLVRWNTAVKGHAKAEPAFARHDLPMMWDFAETYPFGESVGGWSRVIDTSLRALQFAPHGEGTVVLSDARVAAADQKNLIVATDPPYFDQIGYANHSDYFYTWHRQALRHVFPDLYSTRATPKDGELIAQSSRHGGKKEAREYFIEGFSEAFESLSEAQVPDAPMLVVYAFKEKGSGVVAGTSSPGWEAILEAIIAAELSVVGTWPIAGARGARLIGVGTNSLATYVVLVCRPRPADAPRTTRSNLTRLLKAELGASVAELQHANIAPVDLAQAVIGPGMEVYSRHSKVVESDGSRVGVREALILINRTLAEVLDEQEGDLDSWSRWAVTWYEENGHAAAQFGQADALARAKGIAVDGLVSAGIVTSGANKVALVARGDLPAAWNPATDSQATHWEAVQYLVRALDARGELGAAELYATLGALADPARELAYRLFRIAERRGEPEEAIAYNGLVSSWSEIARLADASPVRAPTSNETLF